jgi:hypothetical protein
MQGSIVYSPMPWAAGMHASMVYSACIPRRALLVVVVQPLAIEALAVAVRARAMLAHGNVLARTARTVVVMYAVRRGFFLFD